MTTPSISQSTATALTGLAKYIDLNRWEHNNENHYQWQGEIALSQFPRLYDLRDPNHPNDQPLKVSLDIQQKGKVLFWQLQTTGAIWQTCQRCLEPVAVSLDTDSQLALLADESHVALLEEDMESILLSELSDEHKLWLLPMIEDELLVDLPLAPKHDDCQMAVSEVGELPEIEEERENPFAVLVSLKI
ncbi:MULTISPECIES: YceD family protein [unclassified Moraxella]|uniref:YceD family protein n=1 Tax=unclassified Moraxella TaxID=2685852 RepID=UPI003AF93FC3